MIQALSKHVTQIIFNHEENIESYAIHQYGVEVIISTLINVSMIMLLGLFSDKLIDSVLYVIGFYAIRKFCGGYHCQTYAKCISLHVALFIVYLLSYTWYDNFSLYINVVSMIIFILYAPTKNRDLTKEQYKLYKQISLCILIGYMALAYLTPYSSIITYIIMVVSILIIACIPNNEKHTT